MTTKIINAKGQDVSVAKGKALIVTLKDGTELNVWTFGRHDKDVTLKMEDETRVDFPTYTDYSRSSFGYDVDAGILAKKCCNCHVWFPIARLLPDGSWDDIHCQENVHYDQTRFRSYCNSCYKKKAENKETLGYKKNASKSDSLHKDENTSGSKLIKTTYNISEDDKQFLKILAAIEKVKAEVVLARLISRERKERALKF